MLLPLAVKAGQMLVKKLSKFLANFIKFNKMSKLWCANQFLVLSLYFYKEKKKKLWKCFYSTYVRLWLTKSKCLIWKRIKWVSCIFLDFLDFTSKTENVYSHILLIKKMTNQKIWLWNQHPILGRQTTASQALIQNFPICICEMTKDQFGLILFSKTWKPPSSSTKEEIDL